MTRPAALTSTAPEAVHQAHDPSTRNTDQQDVSHQSRTVPIRVLKRVYFLLDFARVCGQPDTLDEHFVRMEEVGGHESNREREEPCVRVQAFLQRAGGVIRQGTTVLGTEASLQIGLEHRI
jgi:hypothetical protein